MYGMKLSQLTEDILQDILFLYEQIVGGQLSSSSMCERLRWLQEGLEKSNAVDWRYGSKLKTERGLTDRNAKLIVWRETKTIDNDVIIRFYFDPNLISGEEAEQLKRKFEEEVDSLLISKHIAIKIE